MLVTIACKTGVGARHKLTYTSSAAFAIIAIACMQQEGVIFSSLTDGLLVTAPSGVKRAVYTCLSSDSQILVFACDYLRPLRRSSTDPLFLGSLSLWHMHFEPRIIFNEQASTAHACGSACSAVRLNARGPATTVVGRGMHQSAEVWCGTLMKLRSARFKEDLVGGTPT